MDGENNGKPMKTLLKMDDLGSISGLLSTIFENFFTFAFVMELTMSTLCWGWTYLVKREYLSAKRTRPLSWQFFVRNFPTRMGEIGKLTKIELCG